MSQNVNVNLVPGNYPKEFHVSQYDVGRQLVANIVDSTGAYSIPSGATVTLVGTKPSGFGFTLNGSVGSGGVVTFSTTATVTAEYGRIPCELRITSGSTILGTANCMLIVEESPHPEGTTDGDGEQIISEITLLLQRITEQADRADQAVTDATAQANRATAQATAAAGSASAAASSETNAAASEATAVGAKNDAVAAKTAAEASEQAAAESAAEARETLETYAKVDGEYDAMTVGTAKQLLSDSTTTDTEPYIYRQTAGDGDREEVEEVVGGTVAWNQLIPNPTSPLHDTSMIVFNSGTRIVKGHKYIVTFNGKKTDESGNGVNAFWYVNENGASDPYSIAIGTTRIIAPTRTAISNGSYNGNNNTWLYIGGISNATINSFNVIDLTALFNPTIADYIYSIEQSQAGAGVAWFRKLFPKPYYAYNAGELISVKTSSHNTVGFNQWDEEWELGGIDSSGNTSANTDRIRSKNFVPILPNIDYYFKVSSAWRIFYYDANMNFISYIGTYSASRLITTPDNAHYLKFYCVGTTYNHDICINLSSPSRNGEYEEYVKHGYPLDNSLTLRGIPKLDSFNNLYYDGDEYESDGTVTRKYGIVDLGTLTWNKNNAGFMWTRLNDIKMSASSTTKPNVICQKYSTDVPNNVYTLASDKAISVSNGSADIWVYDSAYTDAASFKSAMSGVYLVYELATATTETVDSYTAIQVCDPNGTEEWTDERTVQIPVGNVTKYHANLKEKLEDLPTIPSAPSANGTYTLKATVSGGTVTYQWVNG